MKRTMSRDLTVGVVVLLAALIFTIGVFSIGSEQRIWVSKVGYRILVPEANGLQNGSPVRLAGVQVGTVTSVAFSSDPDEMGIEVDLAVDAAHQHRIRQDTVAQVKILTLLGGEKYIELTPGSPSSADLPAGSFIQVPPGFGIDQLGELSADLSEDLRSISSNVRVILDAVQRQEGVVGRMLLDPNFGDQVFSDVGRTAQLARETIEQMHDGKGLAGKLLSDEQFGRETAGSIRQSLRRIEELLEKASQPDSVVSEALDPNGRISAAMDNLHQATADLHDFTAELKEGRGVLGRMVGDEEYARELLQNIREISDNLADITRKLNEGEGTLGGMINDPQLYEDITHVIRGVKKSKLMSWLIRRYRKEGEQADGKGGKRDDVVAVEPPQGGR